MGLDGDLASDAVLTLSGRMIPRALPAPIHVARLRGESIEPTD